MHKAANVSTLMLIRGFKTGKNPFKVHLERDKHAIKLRLISSQLMTIVRLIVIKYFNQLTTLIYIFTDN